MEMHSFGERPTLRRLCWIVVAAWLGCSDAGAQLASLKINATAQGISGPVAVRAIIRKSDGSFVQGEWNDSNWPAVALRGRAMAPETTIQIIPGATQITVGKGPDYTPQTINVNLVSGQTHTVNVQMQPVFNMQARGWRAGDFHTHFNHGDGEIARTPAQVFAMCAAGGLTFVSLCQEHYGAPNVSRAQIFDSWAPYDTRECRFWIGAEEPKNSWGHQSGVVFDPWSIRSPIPYWQGISQIQSQGGVSFPVHPLRGFPGREDGGWAVYPHNNFFKAYPLHTLIGNLMDGWSGVSDEAHAPGLLPPYFKLLERGYKIPLLADSDISFDRINNKNKAPGFWVNYLYLGGAEPTRANVADAVRKGRVMATTGPLVLFTIDGSLPGSSFPADGATRTARIQASYTFNPWTLGGNNFAGNESCRIAQIDLFRNGQIVKTWNPNSPTATVEYPINETTHGAYYMVRVLGNDAAWMAGYASPIYFENAARPRHPEPFLSLIKGRVYNSTSGNAMPATVSAYRRGQTLWTLRTDSQGRFKAYAPLDARIVARADNGKEFSRDILAYEPVYAFCHNLSDNYGNNLQSSIDPFIQIVREMEWEFPIGYQHSASYVRASLAAGATMTDFSIVSAPPATSGKSSTEIVMLLVDKTQAQPGDTINYAAIFRVPGGGTPREELSIEWKGWDPNFPRMFTKVGKVFHMNNNGVGQSLGNGFFVKKGAAIVPTWAANVDPSSPGLKLSVLVRASRPEEANLLVSVGPTKQELLVSSTWDGFPVTWGDRGIGPCHFHRQLTKDIRYTDYRNSHINVRVNGQLLALRPSADTAHAADADDAVFDDFFYYDGQCEPRFRNLQFRTPPRSQPSVSFDGVPIHNPNQKPPPTPTPTPSPGVAPPVPSSWFGPNAGSEKLVVWQHKDGYTAATYLSATNFVSSILLRDGLRSAAGWRVRGLGDFNSDGASDLVWQNTSGVMAAWFMKETEFQGASLLRNGQGGGAGWMLRTVADMNGDDKPDLIWQHTGGKSAIWYMNDTSFSGVQLVHGGVSVARGWAIVGAGDFNNDGFNDLLWQYTSGFVDVWIMNNAQQLASISLRGGQPAAPGWRIVGVNDFNQDGKTDILWQSSGGALAVWFMDGTRFLRTATLVNGRKVAPEWRVVGTK